MQALPESRRAAGWLQAAGHRPLILEARIAAYSTRPSGEEVLLAYFGGALALELEQRNELAAFARDELSGIFGSGFPDGIRRVRSTAWATDPWARGSYSAALPGSAHEREQLNEALNERVFLQARPAHSTISARRTEPGTAA